MVLQDIFGSVVRDASARPPACKAAAPAPRDCGLDTRYLDTRALEASGEVVDQLALPALPAASTIVRVRDPVVLGLLG